MPRPDIEQSCDYEKQELMPVEAVLMLFVLSRLP